MNELQHTSGPWRIGTPPPNGEQTIGTDGGLMVAVATTGAGVNAEANARRIVACVNACEGLPTEYLETVGLPEFVGKTLCADLAQQELDRVTAQRDQLLVALEMARKKLEDEGYFPSNEIDAAIAAVKGDK